MANPVSTEKWSIYELAYKKGALMHYLYFKCSDINTAVAKGQEYCNKKGLRFIFVNEWLKDIQQMIEFEPDENWHGGKRLPSQTAV